MFYNWKDGKGWVQAAAPLEMPPPSCPFLGLIDIEDLEKLAPSMGLSASTVRQCREEVRYFRGSVEIYEHYTFGTLKLGDGDKQLDSGDMAAFYIAKDFFLLVDLRDSDGSTAAQFQAALTRFSAGSPSVAQAALSFLEGLIEGDGKRLEAMDFAFAGLEESVLKGTAGEDFPGKLFLCREQLLLYHNYYEQLIDIGEALAEDDNKLFDPADHRGFRRFSDKVHRLLAGVGTLRGQLEYCSGAYHAMLELRLNRTMKTFTALSAVFLPLTLLTGWYGMNFKFMPELNWRYGYLLAAALAILIAAICIRIFKKRGLL